MRLKKVVLFLLIAVLTLSFTLLAYSCDVHDDPVYDKPIEEEQLKIVYLGDSIAEAIAGPSPMEERINMGYFGIVGQINNYKFDNRSISGNRTEHLLDYINRETEDANLTKSVIAEADIISVSILGNDILQNGFHYMLYETAAYDKYGDDFVNQEVVKNSYVYEKQSTFTEEDGTVRPSTPGDGLKKIAIVKKNAKSNFENIVSAIKELNPTATLIFQNVYNPMDSQARLISDELMDDLYTLDNKYDISTVEGVAEIRALAGKLLAVITEVIQEYQEDNPDTIHMLDVAKRFDELYEQDIERGERFIAVDGIHPSSEGHAVIAEVLQEKLIELGLADREGSLENYKQIRLSQLERMYKDASNENGNFNYNEVVTELKAQTTFNDVSAVYFNSTQAYSPILYSHPTENRVTNGVWKEEDCVYELSDIVVRNLTMTEQEQKSTSGIANLLAKFYLDEKNITLNDKGEMTLTVGLKLGSLLKGLPAILKDVNLDNMILGGKEDCLFYVDETTTKNLKLSGKLDMMKVVTNYLDTFFPGIDTLGGNFGENLSIAFNSLGLKFEGFESILSEKYIDEIGLPLNYGKEGEIDQETVGKEYNSYIDYFMAYTSRFTAITDYTGKELHVSRTPANLSEMLEKITYARISVTSVYSLKTVVGNDGQEYDAVYLGQYYENASPWVILTEYVDENEASHLKMVLEILGIELIF